MIARVGGALDRFWFADAPAARLAMLRILIGLFALYDALDHYDQWVSIARTSASLFAPVGVASVLADPLSPLVFEGVVLACLAANVAFVLGWRHRVTGPAFALLLFGVLSYRNSWSMIYHSSNLMLLHVVILGLSRSADALSVDAWRRARSGRPGPADSWVYGWPIQLICTITVLSYLLAGVAKVAGPLGWSWATGEGLRSQVAANALRKEVLGDSSPSLFYAIYDWYWLFGGLAGLSLALELGAPLALLDRRLARVWSAATLGMHWGIWFIMGITFRYHLSGLAFASFFPLEVLVPRRWRPAEGDEPGARRVGSGEGSEFPVHAARWLGLGLVVVGAFCAYRWWSPGDRHARRPAIAADEVARALVAARGAADGPRRRAAAHDQRVWLCRHALPNPAHCVEGWGASVADAASQAASGQPDLADGSLTLDVLLAKTAAAWPSAADPADAGLFGIEVGPAVVLPWEVLALGISRTADASDEPRWDNARLAAVLETRSAGGALQGFTKLRTSAWVQEEPGAFPVRLERLHVRDPPDARDPEVLADTARAMADHLASVTRPDGSIRNLYDPRTGREVEGENLVRNAACAHALVEAWKRFGDPEHLDAATRAIGYLLAHTAVDERWGPHGGGRARHVVEGSTAKLGGAALALAAIDALRSATGDLGAWAAEADELAVFLLSQQREDGSFVCYAPVTPGGRTSDQDSAYYPGEAVFALSVHAAVDPDPRWLAAAERAEQWMSRVRDAGKPPAELPADAWRMRASHQLFLDTGDPRWVDRGLELAAPVIHQFRRHQGSTRHDFAGGFQAIPRSTPCGARVAGLAAVLASCDAVARDCREMEPVLFAALAHELWSQVRHPTLFWVVDPDRAIGGLMGGVTDPVQRSDYTQHALTAALWAEETVNRRALSAGGVQLE